MLKVHYQSQKLLFNYNKLVHLPISPIRPNGGGTTKYKHKSNPNISEIYICKISQLFHQV